MLKSWVVILSLELRGQAIIVMPFLHLPTSQLREVSENLDLSKQMHTYNDNVNNMQNRKLVNGDSELKLY